MLGGVSIFGGRGTIAGVVLALLLLAGIQKALTLSPDISTAWIQIVAGALLIGSVLGPNLVHRVARDCAPVPVLREARPPRPGASVSRPRRKPKTDPVPAIASAARGGGHPRPLARPRGCGDDDDSAASSDTSGATAPAGGAIPPGITTISMPKQLGNPYEEIEHGGVTIAMEELGGSNDIVGPTDAGASSQVPLINSATQQEPDAIIIAGNDANAVAPALKQAAQRGHQDRRHGLRRGARRPHVFVSQASAELIGAIQVSRSPSRSATRARSRSSRPRRTRRTRTSGSSS